MKKVFHFCKKYKIWIGSIWGILTTIFSIYLTINPLEQNPKLTLYQKSKIDVFAIDEPVEELQIILNGKDLRKKNLDLKVYQFKLINNGKKDIRKVDYAEEIPFGIHIKNGKMAKINISKTHKTFTSKKILNRQIPDSTNVMFNKVFFGKKEYIMFYLWVEHEKNVEPILSLSGKIADTSIELTDAEESKIQSWWDEYIFPLVLLVLILFGIFWAIRGWYSCFYYLQEKIRSRVIKIKYDHHYDRSNKRHRLIARVYSLYGKKRFIYLLNVIIDPDRINSVFKEELDHEQIVDVFIELHKNGKTTISKSEVIDQYDSDFLSVIEMMEDSKLAVVNFENEEILVDPEMIEDMKLALRLVEREEYQKNQDVFEKEQLVE